ncbi:MAG: hypothetical protein GX209_00335 [Epulopiscium sp.]|nr:hypothetical protein [Candidatus Epulonipiscium sp.]
MEILGIVLVIIGVAIAFAARRIVLGRWQPLNNDEDDKEFLDLIEKGTVNVKIVGFFIVVIGVLFIFL